MFLIVLCVNLCWVDKARLIGEGITGLTLLFETQVEQSFMKPYPLASISKMELSLNNVSVWTAPFII